VRWEVEIHNKMREIPWDVVLRPGPYVVGAYPKALAWVAHSASRIETIRRTEQISYDHMVSCLRSQFGKFVGVMQSVEGSPEKVLQKLLVRGVPKRLRHPLIDDPAEWLE
jgi:phage replication initiation protein